MTTASAVYHITAQDVDVILEAELASHDPAAPARLFTVLQGLLTPTAQQTSRNVVYLHRGINATKRVFFRALCVALSGQAPSRRPACGWVTPENIDDAARILNHGIEGRYPQLLVLDNIPSGTLVEWRHLMSLAATPAVQIHILQDIAWPHEHLKLPTASVEQYDWRDLSSSAVSLRADAVDVLAPAIASWLGIVGAAHPADIAGLCAAPGEVCLTASHLADVPPSARSPRRPLLSATPALWSPGGACADAKPLPTEPECVSRITPQIAPCRKDPCVAPARSAPAVLHLGCGVGCDEDHSKPTVSLTIDGKPVRGLSEITWEETAPEPSVSSSAVTAPVDAPSSVSPSAETWPQESAATATQDSSHSSAETAKPTGEDGSEFIYISGVKLPLRTLDASLTVGAVNVVKMTIRLFRDEHNDWWENYHSVKDRLIARNLREREVVAVRHPHLDVLGIKSLVFTRVSLPSANCEVDLEGIPPRERRALVSGGLSVEPESLPVRLGSLPGSLGLMQARAAQTAIYPGAGTGDRDARLYTALSLAGEAGEVAGKASKAMRDGESSALMAALYTELGDVFWHWLQACAEWGAQPDQIAEAMFQRLQDRQARGVLTGSGDKR
jgi:NTP pyrophosphatase (non-canonical NTP hydrolase)